MISKRLVFALLFLPAVVAVAQKKDADLEDIRHVMTAQQDAWNRVDIEAFMEGYWKSDSLRFIGSGGITYGWQTTLNNYRKRYPSAEVMGKLTFTIITLEKLSSTSAYMIGTYHLQRATDEPHGYFTLVWRKINGRWVIVVDHTS
jgi:ketosteroid isomerase-like protein